MTDRCTCERKEYDRQTGKCITCGTRVNPVCEHESINMLTGFCNDCKKPVNPPHPSDSYNADQVCEHGLPSYGKCDKCNEKLKTDMVNHPPHYTAHPSGIECIQVVEHMGFNLGNAVKYIWRADEKGKVIEDLEKAQFYIAREIKLRKEQSK